MGFDQLLRHTVVIERPSSTGEGDEGEDVLEWTEIATVSALIQPKQFRDVQAFHQAGPEIADHTIFMRPTDVDIQDRIRHAEDLYQVRAVNDAGGQGHHLEVDARRVVSPSLDTVGS